MPQDPVIGVSHGRIESSQSGPGWRAFQINLFVHKSDGSDPSLEDLRDATFILFEGALNGTQEQPPQQEPPKRHLSLVKE